MMDDKELEQVVAGKSRNRDKTAATPPTLQSQFRKLTPMPAQIEEGGRRYSSTASARPAGTCANGSCNT